MKLRKQARFITQRQSRVFTYVRVYVHIHKRTYMESPRVFQKKTKESQLKNYESKIHSFASEIRTYTRTCMCVCVSHVCQKN